MTSSKERHLTGSIPLLPSDTVIRHVTVHYVVHLQQLLRNVVSKHAQGGRDVTSCKERHLTGSIPLLPSDTVIRRVTVPYVVHLQQLLRNVVSKHAQ